MAGKFIDSFKIPKNIGHILSNKYLAILLILWILVTLNTLMDVKFPGISHAVVRPQIVLICLAGFYYGPVYGFLVGFIGNISSDLFLGNGFDYLLSLSIGNGLMGLIMGLNRTRSVLKLYKISQLLEVTLFLILSNVAFVTYSSIIYNLNHVSLTFDANLKYFFLPVLNSNILASLLLFPVFLLLLGRLKINFPIKIALSNFYMTAFFLQVAWFVNKTNFDVSGFIFNSNPGIDEGNQIVQAFDVWSMMLILFLLTSFFISIFISEKITRPIVELDRNVHELLQSDIHSPDLFDKLTRRDDEVGLLSYTIGLLSEKIWDSQVNFINDFAKKEYNRSKNILFQSWYEPLITSDVPLNSYNRINEIVVQHGRYMILTFVTEEALTKALNKLSGYYEKSMIRSRSVWVNDDFYLYLKRD